MVEGLQKVYIRIMDRRKVVIQYLQIVNMVSDGKKHIQRYTIKMGKPQKNRIFLLLFPHKFNES